MTATTNELITGLQALVEVEGCGEAIRLIAMTLRDAGVTATVVTLEDEDDEQDGVHYATSDRELVLGDEESIATWTRSSIGQYGQPNRQCTDATWFVEEDSNGDMLPDNVSIILDVFGIEDDLPVVPEPAKPTDTYKESADGGYAVYWETVSNEGPQMIARYADEEAAVAVCQQKQREFAAKYPSRDSERYLCGYEVRQLVDGKWIKCEEQ